MCKIFLTSTHDRELVLSFLSSSVAADIKAEDLKDDLSKANVIDKNDEDLCEANTQDMSQDCAETEGTQSVPSSQTLMDCASAGALEESDNASGKNNLTEIESSNGQKSKRPSSPGPQPAKTTCVAADASNQKLILSLKNSPRKDGNPSSDVEMLSPTSPLSKSTLVDWSEKDPNFTTYEQDSSSAMSQEVDSQDVVRDSDSGCSAKDGVQRVATETKNAERAECSGACDLIKKPSGASSER